MHQVQGEDRPGENAEVELEREREGESDADESEGGPAAIHDAPIVGAVGSSAIGSMGEPQDDTPPDNDGETVEG